MAQASDIADSAHGVYRQAIKSIPEHFLFENRRHDPRDQIGEAWRTIVESTRKMLRDAEHLEYLRGQKAKLEPRKARTDEVYERLWK